MSRAAIFEKENTIFFRNISRRIRGSSVRVSLRRKQINKRIPSGRSIFAARLDVIEENPYMIQASVALYRKHPGRSICLATVFLRLPDDFFFSLSSGVLTSDFLSLLPGSRLDVFFAGGKRAGLLKFENRKSGDSCGERRSDIKYGAPSEIMVEDASENRTERQAEICGGNGESEHFASHLGRKRGYEDRYICGKDHRRAHTL